jgi:hypothetical protein
MSFATRQFYNHRSIKPNGPSSMGKVIKNIILLILAGGLLAGNKASDSGETYGTEIPTRGFI